MKQVSRTLLKPLRFLIFGLLAVGCASPITSDAWPDQVLQADRFRSDAMVDANPIHLEQVLHDRLTYTHSNGIIDTKNSLVAALISNALDYQSIESKSRSVRMNGRTAIVTGLAQVKVAGDGQQREFRSVYTAAYWLIEDRWQLVAYQSTVAGPN
jgi:hypothetical protein